MYQIDNDFRVDLNTFLAKKFVNLCIFVTSFNIIDEKTVKIFFRYKNTLQNKQLLWASNNFEYEPNSYSTESPLWVIRLNRCNYFRKNIFLNNYYETQKRH